jgi:hypothetical protein
MSRAPIEVMSWRSEVFNTHLVDYLDLCSCHVPLTASKAEEWCLLGCYAVWQPTGC